MKRQLIAAIVSSATATVAAPAFAQSSVTLYGVIDEGVDYTNNVANGARRGSVYELASGYAQGSRWGLKGAEDLGGGLKAVFQLENGFDVNNGRFGQGGTMFGRQAFVGLSANRFGTLTFGRQYDSVVDYLAPVTANGAWAGTLFSHPFDNDNTDNTFRVNNAVKYASPEIAGLQFGGMYGFSNSSNFSNNRAYSFGTSYDYGPLHVAAGYLQLNSNVNAAAANAAGAVSLDTVLIAARQRVFGAGLSYAFGSVTASFVFTQTKLTDPVGIASGFTGLAQNTPLSGDVRFDNYEANVRWSLTPTISLVGGYTYTDSRLDGRDPKWQQVNLQAAYSFSKRTDVFLQGAYQHVSNLGGTGVGAFISSVGMSSTGNQGYAALGMRVRF